MEEEEELTRGCGKKRRVQSQGLVQGNVKRRKGVQPKVEETVEVESSNEEGVESGYEELEGVGSGNEEGVESGNEGVEERLGSESEKELCGKG